MLLIYTKLILLLTFRMQEICTTHMVKRRHIEAHPLRSDYLEIHVFFLRQFAGSVYKHYYIVR